MSCGPVWPWADLVQPGFPTCAAVRPMLGTLAPWPALCWISLAAHDLKASPRLQVQQHEGLWLYHT